MVENVKFYQASTSELFGLVQQTPQSESTPFYPRSPYAVAKLYAYWTIVNYREAYNFYACNGILFNHESPRRGETFVTRKITRGLANISQGLQECLFMGNLDAKRDWGHAKDYVEAMWLMMQQKRPDDFVISTGKQFSVEHFAQLAFKVAGLNYKKYLKIDKKLFRPAEVNTLVGNYKKAGKILKWKPKISFEDLVTDMVESDIRLVEKEI